MPTLVAFGSFSPGHYVLEKKEIRWKAALLNRFRKSMVSMDPLIRDLNALNKESYSCHMNFKCTCNSMFGLHYLMTLLQLATLLEG